MTRVHLSIVVGVTVLVLVLVAALLCSGRTTEAGAVAVAAGAGAAGAARRRRSSTREAADRAADLPETPRRTRAEDEAAIAADHEGRPTSELLDEWRRDRA